MIIEIGMSVMAVVLALVGYKQYLKITSLENKLQEWENFYKNDVTKMATSAGEKLKAWNAFYTDTLEDVSSVIGMLEKLMERETVSDDPDVQNLLRVVAILHDILKNYVSVGTAEIPKISELDLNAESSPGDPGEKGKA
jgi:hypothetical protein